MFRFLRRFASRPAPSPLEAALEALRRRDFGLADRALSALLDGDAPPAQRALVHNKRGVARMGLGRPGQAREDFAAALEHVSRYAPALTNLGNLLLEEGDVDGAIARYESAIAADDSYAKAYFNLGVALKRAGRIDEAVRALRRAQRLEGRAAARLTHVK